MPNGKHILVCRSGAKLMMSEDGSLSYMGGDAYAIGVNDSTRFDELKNEMADMWKYDPGCVTIKYLLPNSKNMLLTISRDKDLKRMLEFYKDSATVDVYVFTGKNNRTSDISTVPGSRSSLTTTVEPFIPVDQVTPADIALPPEPENGLAVYSESDMLRNAGKDEQSVVKPVLPVSQATPSDIVLPPEPGNELAVYSEAAMLMNTRKDEQSMVKPVIDVNQATPSDILLLPEPGNGLAVYSESEMLRNAGKDEQSEMLRNAGKDEQSMVKPVISVNQATPTDIVLPPEPGNELAVYSESEMLRNAGKDERSGLARLWQNCITGVEQHFNTVNEFRDALRKYSVARGFLCTKIRNDNRQVSVKCKGEGCPWEICALRLPDKKIFVIRKLNDTHTCGAISILTNPRPASGKVGDK